MEQNLHQSGSAKFSKLIKEGESTIAWFKLAELVTRKEKEKALSLHRLLSHSFEDKAYALQLEGDMLLSLEDPGAFNKYEQAAFLYKKENKLVQAASVYEHLLTLDPKNCDVLKYLIKFYLALDWEDRFNNRLELLINFLKCKELTEDKFLDIVRYIIKGVDSDQKELPINKNWFKDSFKKIFKQIPKDLIGTIEAYF